MYIYAYIRPTFFTWWMVSVFSVTDERWASDKSPRR
jgi:hypothetical protein